MTTSRIAIAMGCACVLVLTAMAAVDERRTNSGQVAAEQKKPELDLFALPVASAISVRRYYTGVDARNAEQLRQQLHELVARHHRLSNRDIWRVLQASNTAGDNRVQLFYSRRVIPAEHRASGEFQNESDYWNREHIWPQSYGLKKTAAKADVHNIVPADRSINSSRGNKFFDAGGYAHDECAGCRTDRDSWEPPDDVKGDVARMVMYMALRYDGNDSSGAADLRLQVSSDNTVDKQTFGNLALMMLWHCQDPVSSDEAHRNEVIHQAQGNRNPFIDQPMWAEALYGRCELFGIAGVEPA